MDDERKFAVYFSHSWRPRDVDLNVAVWRELADDCELLVDAPEEPGSDPPYYINRIEELQRRSDLFLSVLTYRDPDKVSLTSAGTALRCSPYMLFEIRLAERAEIPRLVLYERSTGFRPPRSMRPWEMYVPFDRLPSEGVIERRQWTNVIRSKIQDWTKWAAEHRRPGSYEQSNTSILFAEDPVAGVVEICCQEAGFDPVRCDPNRQTSNQVFRSLREAGLVIADLGVHNIAFQQLYAAAHALGVPAIRMLPASDGQPELPWILSGEAGGYQNDIVVWQHPEELPPLLRPRMASMFRLSPALRDKDAARYLQSKRYAQFFVFISHNLKPPNRALVELIFRGLDEHCITPFEYHEVNTAGIKWQPALNEALLKTTHFLLLLSPDYEQSPTCTLELEATLTRGDKVTVLPFMIMGRSQPNPKVPTHHRLLSGDDLSAQADEVVREVIAVLDHKLESETAGGAPQKAP